MSAAISIIGRLRLGWAYTFAQRQLSNAASLSLSSEH